eukprot:CAMPEP_0113322774 /NCGR_PEP_ID=MMETSP0010_2-20120614/15832_1 /TAXON_ID=216773 ORGANISM="Corethron hystrix, Strain 308" /NCGR_SAMPLE_ID=MMETSP0010_2 /ASSEMBLY_ACC=CAM_ASM_000155 /LENGTH=57 /DNA_ID=CAMNT_0000181391 /DNA_START=414 /DNA_END=587 /DNA_ORIENTATION=- /assembly_acc=CAM_ASM_000155
MKNKDPTQDYEEDQRAHLQVDNDGSIIIGESNNLYPMTQDSQIEEVPGTEEQDCGFE